MSTIDLTSLAASLPFLPALLRVVDPATCDPRSAFAEAGAPTPHRRGRPVTPAITGHPRSRVRGARWWRTPGLWRLTVATAVTVLFVGGAVAAGGSGAGVSSLPQDVAACIRSPQCDRVFVVAHRSRGFGGPDNSRGAVRAAMAAGQPVIEIDLHRTSDGHVVVFHDALLESSTSGKGKIADQTLARLGHVRLGNSESIPRFDEIYDLTRGRAVLMLHLKVDVVDQVAEWLARHGSLDDAIFYLDHWDKLHSAAPVKKRHPAMMVMARAHRRGDLAEAEERLGQRPEVVHVSTDDRAEVAWYTQHGVKVAIKVLTRKGASLVEEEQRRACALASGAQLIIVDRPRWFGVIPRTPE